MAQRGGPCYATLGTPRPRISRRSGNPHPAILCSDSKGEHRTISDCLRHSSCSRMPETLPNHQLGGSSTDTHTQGNGRIRGDFGQTRQRLLGAGRMWGDSGPLLVEGNRTWAESDRVCTVWRAAAPRKIDEHGTAGQIKRSKLTEVGKISVELGLCTRPSAARC